MSAHRMSNADAAWLHMDRPTNLMVVNALLWFDEPLDVDRARAVVRERLVERFPRFHQRVVGAAARHRRPELGGRPELRPRPARAPPRAAGARATGRARGARGRPDGRAARPQQAAVGHVRDRRLRRGHGGARRACTTASPTASRWRACCCRSPTRSPTPGSRRRSPTAPRRARCGGHRPAVAPACTPPRRRCTRASRSSPTRRPSCSRLRRPRRPPTRAALAQAAAHRRPTPRPRCSGKLGVARRVAWTEPIPLADVKAIGHATGTTVNDVLLAAMTGALHRYLAERDASSTRSARWCRSTCVRSTSRCRATSATTSASSTCRCRSGIADPARAPRRGAPPDGRDQALARGRDLLRHPRR